jgi:N-acetylglutamate synthase-like GNAT family acetyltransferase
MNVLDTVTLLEANRADTERIVHFLHMQGLISEGVLFDGTRYWYSEDKFGRLSGVVGAEFGTDAVLLRSAAVAPEYRQHGIGSVLVVRVMAICRAAGVKRAYCLGSGAGSYWLRYGFDQAPVDEVIAALPNAPQVIDFARRGWLAGETAWRKTL